MVTLKKVCLAIGSLLLVGWQGHAQTHVTGQELVVERVSAPREGVKNFTALDDTFCVAGTPGHWWVGTRGGLVRLNEKTLAVERVYTPADGLAATPISSLAVQGDALWVGVYDGISQLDTKTGSIRSAYVPGFGWRVDFDKDNEWVWAFLFRGALRFDKRTGRALGFPMEGTADKLVRDGTTLWGVSFRTERGCAVMGLDTGTGTMRTKSLGIPVHLGNTRTVELADGQRELWILAESSDDRRGSLLVRVDKETLDGYWQGTATGLPHGYVQELVVAGSDVWVCTTGDYHFEARVAVGGRLCRFNRDSGRWDALPSVSGFKHDEPTRLAVLSGDLWVATRAYDETKKMAIGWGMEPVEGEVPVVKALTLNRFLAAEQRWQTFLVPVENNNDRVIAMALKKERLWFVVERGAPTRSFFEQRDKVGYRVITGYVDIQAPEPKAMLLETPLIGPLLHLEWSGGGEREMDLRAIGDTLWLKRTWREFWVNPGETGWRRLELDSSGWLFHVAEMFVVDGGVFASCMKGGLRYERQHERWSPWAIPSGWGVTDLRKDDRGMWWLAGGGGASFSVPKDSDRNDADRKPLQAGLFRSKDGQAWEVPSIAPWTWQQRDVDGEVVFLSADQVKRRPYSTLANDPRPRVEKKAGEGISCIESHGECVWVGTVGDGVFCLEKNRWRRLWPRSAAVAPSAAKDAPPSPEDAVTSVALDGEFLWIATYAGLRRYNVRNRRLEKVDDSDVGLKPLPTPYTEGHRYWVSREPPVVAHAGRSIWFSGSGPEAGIYCVEKSPQAWRCVLPKTKGRCFAGMDDTVWIGTPEGLLRYDVKSGDQRWVTQRHGLVSNWVLCVAVDDRFVWVGTSYGISRLERRIFDAQ